MTKDEFIEYRKDLEKSEVGLNMDRERIAAALADEAVFFVCIDTVTGQILGMLPDSLLVVDGLTKRVMLGQAADILAEIGVTDVKPKVTYPAWESPVKAETKAQGHELKRNKHIDTAIGWSSWFKNPLNQGKR